ncbi:hypothetical protein WKH79_11260 [Qipengyuania sp. GPGPB31]|uniref:hypothetical protein n=1 Tax=Qipengyuania sp. GPGPB31 TaxID=3023518 RepID=UPI00313438E8
MKIEEVLRLAWVEFAKTDSVQSYKFNQPIWRLNLQERSVEQSLGEIARKRDARERRAHFSALGLAILNRRKYSISKGMDDGEPFEVAETRY